MQWVVCRREAHSRKLHVLEVGGVIDPDDPLFEPLVHILPITKTSAGATDFGVHELKTDCACHPKTEDQDGGTIVIHTDRVN